MKYLLWERQNPSIALYSVHKGHTKKRKKEEETAPAGDDTTYSATFDNTGVVTIDEAKVDGAVNE